MCPASGRFVWAISGVGRFNGLVRSRAQGKNRRLTAIFAHAQPRPFLTDCNQILRVGSGGRWDYWCQVLWKSVKVFRSYRTPPKRHFLLAYLTFIALTTVSALPCSTVIHLELRAVLTGGSADVLDLRAGDELIAIDGADVANHYLESVQSVISQAVSVGHLQLRIRRLVTHS